MQGLLHSRCRRRPVGEFDRSSVTHHLGRAATRLGGLESDRPQRGGLREHPVARLLATLGDKRSCISYTSPPAKPPRAANVRGLQPRADDRVDAVATKPFDNA